MQATSRRGSSTAPEDQPGEQNVYAAFELTRATEDLVTGVQFGKPERHANVVAEALRAEDADEACLEALGSKRPRYWPRQKSSPHKARLTWLGN